MCDVDDRLILDVDNNILADIPDSEVVRFIEKIGLPNLDLFDDIIANRKQLNKRTYNLALLAKYEHPNYKLVLKPDVDSDLIAIKPPFDYVNKFVSFRESSGIGKRRLADLIGVTGRKQITEFENGERSPSKQTWGLFLLVTGNHPYYSLISKA